MRRTFVVCVEVNLCAAVEYTAKRQTGTLKGHARSSLASSERGDHIINTVLSKRRLPRSASRYAWKKPECICLFPTKRVVLLVVTVELSHFENIRRCPVGGNVGCQVREGN